MEELDEEQRHIRAYLLGYLDEGRRQVVEERLLADADYQGKVLVIESELMEEYLDGKLSERDRERFIKHILPTRRQVEKLRLAEALSMHARVDAAANSPPITEAPTRPLSVRHRVSRLFRMKPWRSRLPIAVAVLLITFGGLMFLLLRNKSSEATEQRKALEQELAKLNAEEALNPAALSHGFIIGPIKPGLVRDEKDINKFTVPETEGLIQLRLQVGAGDYQTFQAVLQTNENQEIFNLSNLKDKTINGGRLVLIYLPSKVLTPGDYQLRLSGLTQSNRLEYLARYTFRMLGK